MKESQFLGVMDLWSSQCYMFVIIKMQANIHFLGLEGDIS